MTARTFILERDEDPTGISGVGPVAEGVRFTDGVVVLHWLGAPHSTGVYPGVFAMRGVHCHDGKTRIVWAGMTVPSAPSALLAHLAILAAAATAEYGTFSTAQERLDVMRTFTDALIDAYPALAAAIRDLAAQVAAEQKGCEQAMADAANWEADNKKLEAACTALAAQVEGLQRRADSYEHGMNENGALVTRTRAERDALAARLDAAEKVCMLADIPAGPALRAFDAWRALSPSGGGHDTDTGGGE